MRFLSEIEDERREMERSRFTFLHDVLIDLAYPGYKPGAKEIADVFYGLVAQEAIGVALDVKEVAWQVAHQ